MKPLALGPAQQRRLEKLARDAGRSPQGMLRFVLRDGFDLCEWELRESRLADEQTRAEGTLSNDEVQRQARSAIAARHVRGRKQAA